MPYIPHTPEDIKAMLNAIGAQETQALFDEIPPLCSMQAFNTYLQASTKWIC